MAITLRNTKGIALTHNELDGNFTDLDTRSCCLEASVTTTNVANWNSAYGWGDHSSVGYLCNLVEDQSPQLGQDLDVGGNSIVSTTNGPINIAPHGTGKIVLSGATQLGGSLDVNGQKITSLSNADIDIEPNGTGNVLLGNFKFDADQSVGAGQDNYVMTYDHSTGSISLEASSGGSSYTNSNVDTHLNTSSATGNQLLCWTGTDYAWTSSGGVSGISNIVEDTNPQLGGPLQLNGNDIITGQNRIAFHGSGTVSFMDFTVTQFGQTNNAVLSSVKSINFFLDSNGGDSGQAFRIFNNIDPDSSPTETSYIFKVEENGDVNVTGKILLTDGGASSNYAAFGNDQDLKIFHNGSHSIIRETGTGSLYLQSDDNVILSTDTNTEVMIKGIANGAVELYHDNVKKLETTATGVTVTGTVNGHTIPAGTGTFALLSDITSTSNTISQLNTNITVTDTGTNGTITFDTDGTDRWQFTSAGHLLPVAHCSYDIGSASQQIRHIFISDNSIKFGDAELPMTVTASRLHFNSAKLMVDVIDDATPQLGGDLDVSTFDIVSITNRNIDILPHGTGKVNIDGDGSAGGVSVSDGLIEVRSGTSIPGAIDFYCEVNNAHKVTLKAPAHGNFPTSDNVNFTLPASNGTSGQYLKTDGAGNTSWVTISAGDATLAGTQTFTGDKTFSGKVIGTITDNSATGSFDLNNGNNFKLTPTGATTIDFTNMTAGQSGNIYLDNSGGHTISKDSTIKMLASQLNTISNTGVYWLSYYCIDGTNVVLTASGKLT